MPREYIREILLKHIDSKYRTFHTKLIPNISHEKTLGVRIPQLRAIATQIIKDDLWRDYLDSTPEYLEEIMLQAIIIGHVKVSLQERIPLMEKFIPFIDNWAVCDTFCCTLKLKGSEKEELWRFLQSYFQSDKTYDIRVAVVMSLANYAEISYVGKVFDWFDRIENRDYYVQMAIAWAISVYFVKERDVTMDYLKNNKLDKFTQNKAIQKIRESWRVSHEDKEHIKLLKRK